MDTEKVKEFKNYLQEVIDGNGTDVLGTRAVFNNSPSKKITVITGVLKIPQDEEIVIFFDDTMTGSGKGGLVLTSRGVWYKDGASLAKWSLSWEELSGKYSFVTDGGMLNKKLKLRNGKGSLFTVEKEIALTMASFDIEWLKRILINGCRIFTGKLPVSEREATANTETGKELQEEAKPNDTVFQIPVTKPEPEKVVDLSEEEDSEKKDIKEKEPNEYYRPIDTSNISGESLSFLAENKGGAILAVVLVLLTDFTILSEGGVSVAKLILFCILNLISLPLAFIGSIIGNKIRLWLHPDFVIASGFWGLLKEKLFWRFGPQLIGAVIGSSLGAGLIFLILGGE
jgi:hypothetical protein